MSNYTELVDIRCPESDHLLAQARKGMTAHVVIRCLKCKSYVLIEDVDRVQKIDPPPGTYTHSFTVSQDRRRQKASA